MATLNPELTPFQRMVPRRPETDIRADIERRRGNAEKVPTAASDAVLVKGVVATSRYQKDHELVLMAEWIWGLRPDVRVLVSSVFCDSQAQWCFSINCKEGGQGQWHEWYGIVAETLDDLCLRRRGGHNGISVFNDDGKLIYDLPPIWGGDGWDR